jgi:hypothetical protein
MSMVDSKIDCLRQQDRDSKIDCLRWRLNWLKSRLHTNCRQG